MPINVNTPAERMMAGTGLYLYRARYYSPTLQRFISEDPLGFGGGTNGYAYVGNNPVSWIDPFGYRPRDKWYGHNERDFQDWFHKNWKQKGEPDAGKEDIDHACREWKNRGRPTRDPKGERRMPGRNSHSEPETSPDPMPEPQPAPNPGPVTDSERKSGSPISEFSDFVRSHPAQFRVGVGVIIVGGAITIFTRGAAAPLAFAF